MWRSLMKHATLVANERYHNSSIFGSILAAAECDGGADYRLLVQLGLAVAPAAKLQMKTSLCGDLTIN